MAGKGGSARVGAILALLVAGSPAVAPAESDPAGFDCATLLEAGGFSTRFRVIDPLSRVTACRIKGVLGEEEFQVLLGRRVDLWLQHCFSDRERGYLKGVLRQGTMQTMPFVTRDNCATHLERLMALPESP